MAKEKIAGLMATGIDLNTNGAVESLGKLKSAVKDSTNEWKQMESQMKQSGDELGAAKARYEGLSKSVSEQKEVLAKVKAEQAEVNRSTNDGEKAYQKYASEITSAERKLTSLISQSEKAKQSYQYQESGLAKLDEELKRSNDLTDAKVKKLEAEGRTEEANKVKLAGLTEQQSIYTKKLEIQKAELDKLGESGDKNSKSYKQQELRVEQMGAKLAQATGKIQNFNHTEVKPETTGITKAKAKLERFNDLINKSNSNFKSVFAGTAVAQGAIAAISSMTNSLRGAVEAGAEFNKEQDTMKTVWHALTTSAPRDGKELVNFINQMSNASIYSADSVNEMAQSFYHVKSNVGDTKKWTQDFINLGSTMHLTDSQLAESGKTFSKIVAGGKVGAEDLNMMIDRFPMFGEAVEKSSGKSMQQLRQMSAQGKLTSDVFVDAMDELGEKYKDGQAEAMTSFQGMSMYLSKRKSQLFGEIEKSSFDMSKSMKNDILDLTSDKSMETYAKAISKAIGNVLKVVQTIMDYVRDHKKDLEELFSNVFKITGIFAGAIWDTIKKTLEGVSSAFGGMGDKAKKSHDPLKNINNILETILKHKDEIKEFGKIVATAFVAKKVLGFGNALLGTSKKIVDPLSKMAKKMIFKPEVKTEQSKKELTWLGNKAKSTGQSIKKGLKATANVATKTATKSFELLKKGAKSTGKLVGKAVSVTAKVVTKGAQLALKGLLTTAKVTGKGMKLAFSFLTTNPFGIMILAIAAVVAGFVALYKHSKTFRKFVDGIVKSAKNFAKTFGKAFSGAWNSVTKGLGNFTKGFSNTWNKFGDNTNKAWNATTGKLKDSTSKYFDVEKRGLNLFSDFFTGKWGNLGKDLKKIWNALWDFLESIFGKKIGNIKTGIENFGGRIAEIFNDIKKKVSDTWQGLWDGMKDIVKNGINAVIDIVNSGTGGINSVIHTFGGKKDAIGKISHISKFAKGTKGAPKGLAMVNDAPGNNFHEAIVDNSGRTHVLEGRNRLVNFSGGETVIPAHAIPKFAKGTDNWLGSIGNWFKDKWEGLTEIIKHPLKSMKKVMGKAVSGMIGNQNDLVKNLAPALGNGLVGGIVDPIKKMFENLKKKHEDDDGGGGRGAPSGAGVQRWKKQVIDALKANGLSTSDDMVNKVLRQIATESGGNEKAVQGNIGDVNNASGDLAKGLMQTISATFNAYKFPGHGNIFNGYDNLLAALKYAKSRYGNNLSSLGNGHGYENGGIVSRHGLYEVAERNMPEMIIPLSADKRSKAVPLLQEANRRINGSQNAVSSTTDLSSIENGMNQMITLMSMLLGVSKEQLTALSSRKGFSVNDLYSKMATDSNLRNSTTI